MNGVLGGKYTARDLVIQCQSLWPENSEEGPYIVCTGGEPALQLDQKLIDEFHKFGCLVAVETNGTLELPQGLDWICISPKANTEIVLKKADEIKIVYPQTGINPANFANMPCGNFFIQPMDNQFLVENTRLCVDYCKANPKWSLSVQMHKYIKIP